MRAATILSCLAALAADGATAGEAPAPGRATVTVERHHTSNALDTVDAVPDWYTVIRGTLGERWEHDAGSVSLGLDVEATRHDRISIEDDRAAVLALEALHRLGPGVELRGTLRYGLISQGDHIDVGTRTVGTRALTQLAAAGAELGIDLGGATALVLDVSDAVALVGDTRFEDDLAEPQKLDPDTNRLRFGARLARTAGAAAYGVSMAADHLRAEPLGDPPVQLSSWVVGLRAEAGYRGEHGDISTAAGVEALRGQDDVYQDVRPAYRLAFTRPLPGGLELRSRLRAVRDRRH